MDLDKLLAGLSPKLADDVFVFATLDPENVPDGVTPRMMFREDEGVTLILTREEAEAAGIDHHFPCRMITLDVHSSLEAVGFLARVATALAAEGMGVNPVAGYFHDHLFIPLGREQDAMAVLRRLASEA